MGRRQVHVIRVRKRVSYMLLALTTLLLAGLLYLLSGKVYAAETAPADVLARLIAAAQPPASRDTLLAFLMPVMANVLLFAPWGFFAFVALDAPKRRRTAVYIAIAIGALLFSTAMYLWQQYLPTRVTSVADTIANGLGALGGAALGHARKSIRIRFEI